MKYSLNIKDKVTNKLVRIVYDHLGNAHSCLKEMCKHYGMTVSAYRYRIKHGETLEEALTSGKYRLARLSDHLGNYFVTEEEMCEFHNVPYEVFRYKALYGKNIQECLEGSTIKPKDHLGREFESLSEMLKFYGMTQEEFTRALNSKLVLRDIFTKDTKKSRKKSYKNTF